MKLDELLSLLCEAPIVDFQLKGDWNGKGGKGWDKTSSKLYQKEIGKERLIKMWEKTPYNFEIILLKKAGAQEYIQHGDVSSEFLKKHFDLEISPEQDKIKIIYTNNLGINKIPATPWTLAHRFGHTLFTSSKKNSDGLFKEYEGIVKEFLIYVLSYVYNQGEYKTTHFIKNYGTRMSIEDKKSNAILKRLINQLGTFRSARENKVLNLYEFLFELIAQYLITGKITLNKNLPDLLVTKYNWGKPSGYRKNPKYPDETIERDFNKFELEIENSIEYILNNAEEKIFVM